jgi:hypothetical protein
MPPPYERGDPPNGTADRVSAIKAIFAVRAPISRLLH